MTNKLSKALRRAYKKALGLGIKQSFGNLIRQKKDTTNCDSYEMCALGMLGFSELGYDDPEMFFKSSKHKTHEVIKQLAVKFPELKTHKECLSSEDTVANAIIRLNDEAEYSVLDIVEKLEACKL